MAIHLQVCCVYPNLNKMAYQSPISLPHLPFFYGSEHMKHGNNRFHNINTQFLILTTITLHCATCDDQEFIITIINAHNYSLVKCT